MIASPSSQNNKFLYADRLSDTPNRATVRRVCSFVTLGSMRNTIVEYPWPAIVTVVTRYLSKSVNSFFISVRALVHKVSTKISQDCPSRSERRVSFGKRSQDASRVTSHRILPAS